MQSSKVMRKRSKTFNRKNAQIPSKKKPLPVADDEEIPSDIESDLEDLGPQAATNIDLDDEIELDENPAEKNLRLAKKYLAEIQELERERNEQKLFDSSLAADKDEDADEVEETKVATVNKFYKKVAESYEKPDESTFQFLRNGHRLPVTCIAIAPDASFLISGGKDGRLVKWDLKSHKKQITIHEKKKGHKSEESGDGHSGLITALAIAHDSKFLASGDTSTGIIKIWDPSEMKLLEKLEGHRSSITGLVFRRGTHNLYSCSHDRSVKSWNVDELSYIETMYGHQEPITAIDAIYRERAITAGGRDSSLRLWKIPEESQLVFQASPGSCVDTVKFLDNQHFISGADDGSISLWGLMKKKPLTSIKQAHSSTHDIANWICSVASLFNTDLFASGSSDGKVCLWRASDGFKKIEPLFSLNVDGFINSLEFSANGDLLVIAVGKEHRMGRWWNMKHVKNQIVLVPLTVRK